MFSIPPLQGTIGTLAGQKYFFLVVLKAFTAKVKTKLLSEAGVCCYVKSLIIKWGELLFETDYSVNISKKKLEQV